MSLLTAQQVVRSGNGLTPVMVEVDKSSGDRFVNTGREFIYLTNGSGDTVDVDIETPITADGLDVDEYEFTLAIGETRFIGPFPKRIYNRPAGNVYEGQVIISDYEDDNSVEIAVLRIV